MTGSAKSRLGVKLLSGFLVLWLLALALAVRLGALPDADGGRVLVVFPPGLPAEDRLLAIVAAEGRPVLPMLGGVAWLAESDSDSFVGRLKASGAWAAYHPDIFAVLPEGGCFYISVRKPGPPQPHPPI